VRGWVLGSKVDGEVPHLALLVSKSLMRRRVVELLDGCLLESHHGRRRLWGLCGIAATVLLLLQGSSGCREGRGGCGRGAAAAQDGWPECAGCEAAEGSHRDGGAVA